MSRICLEIAMELLSDTIISSGHSVPGGEDIALRTDEQNRPFLPGSTLKGLLRESVQNYLCWTNGSEQTLNRLFGVSGWADTDDSGRLIFSNLHLSENTPAEEAVTSVRAFTAVENGVARAGSLRLASCLNQGLVFTGSLFCDSADQELVETGLRLIREIGLLRNRGFGEVRFSVNSVKEADSGPELANASCLRYRFTLKTPLAISRQSENSENNNLETQKYIPGATVRGMVFSTLAQSEPEWFKAHRVQLLQNTIRFTPAFPVAGEMVSIPFPSGFYGDKRGSQFYSVLTQNVVPGHKRVSGDFCQLDGCIVKKVSPKITNALRISRDAEKQMFTAKAIAAGTVMEGYIYLDEPAFAPAIAKTFRPNLSLGAKRYAGNGLCCEVTIEPVDHPDWLRYSYAETDAIPETLYLMLLSPTAMYDEKGEIGGLNMAVLAELLQVESVEISACATSVTEIRGFNRTWGCESSAVVMYERGSVFQLHCSHAPSFTALRALEREGLGIRRNEGYGQVLFLKSYPDLHECKSEEPETTENSAYTKLRRARCLWLLERQIPDDLSSSQIGTIQALCEKGIRSNSYSELEKYFEHNKIGRGYRHGSKFDQTYQVMQDVWEKPLSETLGGVSVPEEKDSVSERLALLRDWIDLSRKESDAL